MAIEPYPQITPEPRTPVENVHHPHTAQPLGVGPALGQMSPGHVATAGHHHGKRTVFTPLTQGPGEPMGSVPTNHPQTCPCPPR
jgi:hypothetical protein